MGLYPLLVGRHMSAVSTHLALHQPQPNTPRNWQCSAQPQLHAHPNPYYILAPQKHPTVSETLLNCAPCLQPMSTCAVTVPMVLLLQCMAGPKTTRTCAGTKHHTSTTDTF